MGEQTVTYNVTGVRPDDIMVGAGLCSGKVGVRNWTDVMEESVCSYLALGQGSWQCR